MPDTPTTPNTPHNPPPKDPVGFAPVAGALAILFPGAGHLALKQTARGLYIALGILGLFISGLLIGGIDAIDRKEDFVWFLGQGLVGPLAFAVDHHHQNNIKVVDPNTGQRRSAGPHEIRHPTSGEAILVRSPEDGSPMRFRDPRTNQTRMSTPADRPPNTKSLGRMNELGTLFITIAGMLNLIAILDAAFPRMSAMRGGRN